MHIIRDIDPMLNKIADIHTLFEPFVNLIQALLDDTSMMITIKDIEATVVENEFSTSKLHFVSLLGCIIGEILAKNLVARKQMLALIFDLIDVEQQDEVLKETGRQAIDFALKLSENDQSVDFFKYLPCFIIPVLKNSAGSGNTKFSVLMARLFKLLPLNKAGVFDKQMKGDEDFNPTEEYEQGFEFLRVLSNKKSDNKDQILKDLQVQTNIREYQEHGIAWIASLTDFGFNCALCDDMGLGKTLQALAVVAIKVRERKQKLGNKKGKTISLVICPSTLVHNWNNEINKFFKNSDLKGCVYDETQQFFNYKVLKTKVIPKNDILIMSYEKLRCHYEFFSKFKFMFIILDEAHLIKNSKSQTTKCIKELKAEKKLILTGTPLQNRVTELWSIFDFLMPGFLEDESTFNKKYTRYLTTSLKKVGQKEKETEQFLMSIQSLRERISPFILRRTKENVMKELPPKILQDYQ